MNDAARCFVICHWFQILHLILLFLFVVVWNIITVFPFELPTFFVIWHFYFTIIFHILFTRREEKKTRQLCEKNSGFECFKSNNKEKWSILLRASKWKKNEAVQKHRKKKNYLTALWIEGCWWCLWQWWWRCFWHWFSTCLQSTNLLHKIDSFESLLL